MYLCGESVQQILAQENISSTLLLTLLRLQSFDMWRLRSRWMKSWTKDQLQNHKSSTSILSFLGPQPHARAVRLTLLSPRSLTIWGQVMRGTCSWTRDQLQGNTAQASSILQRFMAQPWVQDTAISESWTFSPKSKDITIVGPWSATLHHGKAHFTW